MRDNLDRLRAQHAEILTIALEIEHLLAPSDIRNKTTILRGLMADLTRSTLAHLVLEDQCLYREMLLSSHDETRALARQHVISMGNIAESLKKHARHWKMSSHIAAEPEKFCADTRQVLGMLKSRIDCEEQALYPEAEQAH